MATFEERILQFLDGERENGSALDEPSREQLLREVSESPEKRRVFTAHLKLRELLGIGRKPSSAPLDVQRDLAQKLPVLALHLPYLAQDSRKERAAGFWSSSSTILRVGIVAGILAIGGGAWYLSSYHHSLPANDDSITHSAQANSRSSLTPASGSSNTAPSSRNTTQSANNTIQGSSKTTQRASNTTRGSANSTKGTSVAPSTIGAVTVNSSASNVRSPQSGLSSTGTNHIAENAAAMSRASVHASHDNMSTRTAVMHRASEHHSDNNAISATTVVPNTTTNADPASLATIDRLPTHLPTERPGVSEINTNFFTLPTETIAEEAIRKTSFWLAPQFRVLLLPHVALSQPSTGAALISASGPTVRTGYWAGIDRELGNGWSGGFRIGYLALEQMQTVTYSEPTPNYPLLTRYRRETLLKDTSSFVVAPEVSYSLAILGGNGSMAAFGGVGFSQLNWIAGIHTSFEYPLIGRLSFESALDFDVTSVKSAPELGGNVLNSYTLGVQNIQSEANTLLTPAFGISLGLSFKP